MVLAHPPDFYSIGQKTFLARLQAQVDRIGAIAQQTPAQIEVVVDTKGISN
jgi:hypothetical protein